MSLDAQPLIVSPDASYMTTIENTNATTNISVIPLFLKYSAAVVEITKDVCELGNPPEPTKRSKCNVR